MSHFEVQHKLTQHCKSTILQLKNREEQQQQKLQLELVWQQDAHSSKDKKVREIDSEKQEVIAGKEQVQEKD